MYYLVSLNEYYQPLFCLLRSDLIRKTTYLRGLLVMALWSCTKVMMGLSVETLPSSQMWRMVC